MKKLKRIGDWEIIAVYKEDTVGRINTHVNRKVFTPYINHPKKDRTSTYPCTTYTLSPEELLKYQ